MFDLDQSNLSLSRQAYEQLRDQIITLKLAPGDLLDEGELMKKLNLGRTPIREALQRLSCEGLVVIRPRRGTYVSSLSLTDLQQLFELRQELEGFAAALAAERATETDLGLLTQALAPLDMTPEPVDNFTCVEVDRAFHLALAHATHNKFLEAQLARLFNLQLRLLYLALPKLGSIRDGVEQHRTICEAITCHDSHIAESAMRKHVQDFQMRIKAAV